jgi:hypothetical protein
MKTKIFFFTIISLLLTNCGIGGPDLPPFAYADNSRIIIEGILQDSNGNAVQNQIVVLQMNRYEKYLVNITFSDAQGKFYISAPKGNYEYTLVFNYKNIISMQEYQTKLIKNTENPELYFGFIPRLNENYYDFKIIKITSI